MALKGWIRLAASTLSLVPRTREIVSQIGLIVFGLGGAWGFILLLRNSFVCISRQRLADIFKRYSLCLSQVAGVAALCASVHGWRPFVFVRMWVLNVNTMKAVLVMTDHLAHATNDGAQTLSADGHLTETTPGPQQAPAKCDAQFPPGPLY